MAFEQLDGNASGGKTMAGEFDSRLTILERHAISTVKRLDAVDGKLDQIVAAVTRAESKPQFNPAAIMSFVKDAGILIGMAAAAIIYIATNISNTPLTLLDHKVGELSRQIAAEGWKARVEGRR
jgi:hypothetical protein